MSSISCGWPQLFWLYPNKRHSRHPVDGLMYFTVLELGLTLSHQQLFAIHPCSKTQCAYRVSSIVRSLSGSFSQQSCIHKLGLNLFSFYLWCGLFSPSGPFLYIQSCLFSFCSQVFSFLYLVWNPFGA